MEECGVRKREGGRKEGGRACMRGGDGGGGAEVLGRGWGLGIGVRKGGVLGGWWSRADCGRGRAKRRDGGKWRKEGNRRRILRRWGGVGRYRME